MTDKQIRLRWQVSLRSPRKLLCHCPTAPTEGLAKSPKGKDATAAPGWCRTELVYGSQPTPERRGDHWQSYGAPSSPGAVASALPPQGLLCLHWHPSLACDVERGLSCSTDLCAEAFHRGLSMARAASLRIPDVHLMIRRPEPKYLYISGFRSSLLLGAQGQLPQYRGDVGIASLELHDSPCLALGQAHGSQAQARGPLLDLLPGGGPCLTWATTWHPWEQRQALAEWLVPFHEALAATGEIHHTGTRLSLELRQPNGAHPRRIVEGLHPHDRWAEAEAWLRQATEQSEAQSLTPPTLPHTEVWRWDQGGGLALAGWLRPPPYHVIGRYAPPPTQRPQRQAMESRQPHLLPASHRPRQIKGVDESEDLAPGLGWRWREKWELRGLSPDVIDGLLATGRGPLLEKMAQFNPKTPPQLWGELLVRWPRGLTRKGCPIDSLSDERWMSIASLHGMGLCQREGLRDLLAFAAYFPDQPVRTLLRTQMGVTPLSDKALRKQLPVLLEGPLPRATSWPARERFWMGRLMQQLRGAIPGKIVRRELYRHFSQTPPTPLDQCAFPPPSPRKKGPKRPR